MIVAPDLMVLARTCLVDGLQRLGVPGLPVVPSVPNPRAARFVTFDVVGGRKSNLRVAHHMVIAHCYDTAARQVQCGELARQVAAVLEDAADHIQCVTVTQVESVFRTDDPDLAGVARFQATVSWIVAYPPIS